MNKLMKILFPPRPAVRDAISARRIEDHIPARRERLISVWTPDPETGRLICTWRRPVQEENNLATTDAGEPPPAVQMAA
jgi:hypothetical protein